VEIESLQSRNSRQSCSQQRQALTRPLRLAPSYHVKHGKPVVADLMGSIVGGALMGDTMRKIVSCSVKGCPSDISKGGHGLCGKHAQRFRRYGDVNYVTPESRWKLLCRAAQLLNIGERKKTTYLKYLGRHEHRIVAEKMLGRKLTSKDVVHHKDGDRHNNDPSNLEVMNHSQHAIIHAKLTFKRRYDNPSP